MEIGFAVPVSGSWATPENQVRIARRAEELGYHSLWAFQRLLFPAEPATKWAEAYRSVQDPVVTLAYLAGHTERVRLGVAVLNMPFFSPALLAKQAATLDVVSAGRLDLGLGLGWSREEYAASGVPYEHRGRRGEEFLRALHALWTEEVAEFHGDFYDFPPVRLSPKPVQRPHPPVLLGGAAEPALRRAGRLADGWISSSGADLSRLKEPIAMVKEAARAAGRDPESLRFVCRGVVRVGPPGNPERRPLTGSYEEIRGDLDMLRAQGVTELFYDLNFDPGIGSPDADPAASMRRAEEALEALAP
ncbi:luciferase [Carbonactinospora thermoautotrophica]|uniref:Luciferase n=1 Tax=Carbonactinospora thermoautotrophica TaxID=1469144 RepID=A0A132MTE0_9ACTN|nr:TIGR03619 family F420-dependent LLM class oxidoreductase [Carbonactinospora thermoautotrophica]KWX01064.1 Luciferase-like monooxygenase [Carbonactinospora thermoautotrophica]KWX04735.1 luciferase [Carbonactinospora thermoautotrophica]KWX09182.1 luciferase [Carbonactinospora thermoautotrophica]